MTLNGIPITSFDLEDSTLLRLTTGVGDLSEALKCVTEEMVILDGVGNQAKRFYGFTEVIKASIIFATGCYELVLQSAEVGTDLHSLKERASSLEEALAQTDETLIELYEMIGG